MKIQEQSIHFHENFHSLLDKSEEPFSLVTDYFGKNIFKKVVLISDWQYPFIPRYNVNEVKTDGNCEASNMKGMFSQEAY